MNHTKYHNSPEILQKFLTYIDTIKGKSTRTADAYFTDLQTFFRFILVHKNITPAPPNFNSPEPTLAINALKEIPINTISVELLKSITIDDLYSFMAYLNRTRGNNARSRARKTSVIRVFFRFLHGNLKIIDSNPAELLEAPKIGKSLPVHLDLESSKNLLSAAKSSNNKRDHLILTLFLNCGMRLSELTGINLTDINKNTIIVTGKGNKQRTIYLNQACLDALAEYLPIRESIKTPDKALILNKNNTRLGPRGVENIVKKYLKLAGLDSTKYSTHKLRHTAATLMYQHGNVDVRALQEILGHEQLSTTEIYTHIDQKRLQDAVNSNPLANE